MNRPNYFLTDLPPEATISPTMLREACLTLKRNREQYLATRTTEQLIRVLVRVGENWLQPDDPFRTLALEQGPAKTGFSRATIERGLDSFFSRFTTENFQALLIQEFGDAKRLDESSSTAGEQNRAAIVTGPEFLVHIAAGNIPNPTFMSIVLGLLMRSAQFVKCASGSAFLPGLFAHSIYETDRKLGACLELAAWRGGQFDLEEILFAEADCVTATGNDETLIAIQKKLPAKTRFVGHGQRVSFGYVASEGLTGIAARPIIAAAAQDVIAWNQLGCLSPHVIYVQTGGGISPEQFSELLANELERCEAIEPRGDLPPEIAANIASRRGIYEIRAAHSPETRLWTSKNSTAWTVVFETDPRFQVSCLHRFIYVKPVKNLEDALHNADSVRGKVSTVGLAAPEHIAKELATQLARWGATRICPFGRMQNPPLTWRHDGRPTLGDLITWTDFEK